MIQKHYALIGLHTTDEMAAKIDAFLERVTAGLQQKYPGLYVSAQHPAEGPIRLSITAPTPLIAGSLCKQLEEQIASIVGQSRVRSPPGNAIEAIRAFFEAHPDESYSVGDVIEEMHGSEISYTVMRENILKLIADGTLRTAGTQSTGRRGRDPMLYRLTRDS